MARHNRDMKFHRRISAVPLLGGLLLALTGGCVTSTTDQFRHTPTSVGESDRIAIIPRRDLQGSADSETAFVDCVATKTASGSGAPAVLSEQQFLDKLYPWFEPRVAPSGIESMAWLLDQKPVIQRIEEMGLKYLVWIEGTTQRLKGIGNLQCAMASGGIPACFGMLSWDMKSDYEANVWDVQKAQIAGKLSQEASGTSFLPAVVVPLPFIAQTRAHACQKLSEQLKAFITST